MRKIPAAMATQHPDNALAPFWDEQKDPFVSVHKEIGEAVECFKRLGVNEYMWDWEGKHADAAVIDKLFSDHYEYFSKNQLNRDKFLTFRIPNIWEEKGYSLLQAMTVILTAEDFAHDLKLTNRPLFEIILPMTENSDQLMKMHILFEKLANFKSKEFTSGTTDNQNIIELIPLAESIHSQQTSGKLLRNYVAKYSRRYGKNPEYIRPFFARSDPALVSGMLATVLANKIALSQAYEFSKESGIPVFPISGVGSLPFRGGLNPDSLDGYLKEYPGMRTVTIQSSFRYDHPTPKVIEAINELENKMPKTKPVIFNQKTEKALIGIGEKAERYYHDTLIKIVPQVRNVFDSVPRRRERRQHIGLLAYGRKVGNEKMPRAITFTAGFYSLGAPPEFIGMGRALKSLSKSELQLVLDSYKSIKTDLEKAGRYLNTNNLNALAEDNPAWNEVKEDIELARQILDLELQPQNSGEKAHLEATSKILNLSRKPGGKLTKAISDTAVLRKSLG